MTGKLRIDLQILLPQVPDESDACVRRLIDDLAGRNGISQVHLRPGSDGTPTQLCVHHDPDVVPLARIREVVERAGAAISERYGHALWEVKGIGHQRRARTVAEQLKSLGGVLEAEASAAGVVHVEFDRSEVTEAHILKALAGMQVVPAKALDDDQEAHGEDGAPQSHRERDDHFHGTGEEAHAHGGLLGPNTELIFSLTCGTLLVAGFLVDRFVAGAPAWLPLSCYVAAYFFGGFYTLREAIDNLRLKRFEIDTLMLVAAAGAAALGSWAEGALLLFLFSLGHALEHYAMGRAKRAIEALAEIVPGVASVRRGGRVQEIAVEELVVGDVVLIKPNERLSADGFLVLGNSSVNQAPVTGESIPVDKRPVDDPVSARARPDRIDAASRVFAGTINGSGAIEVEVTRKSSDSALARVVQMVSEAETRKSPTQRFTDRFERIFVPAVLVLGLPAAVRVGGRRRAVPRQLLPRDGGAGGRQSLRTGHRHAQRSVIRHCPRGPRRRADQGRRAAGGTRFAQRDGL